MAYGEDWAPVDERPEAGSPSAGDMLTAKSLNEDARKTKTLFEYLAAGTIIIGAIASVVLFLAAIANFGDDGGYYSDPSTAGPALLVAMAVTIAWTVVGAALMKLGALVAGHIAIKNS